MTDNKRDNSGILFDNDRKNNDRQPDFKGSCTIGGVDYWISGWNKSGAKGPFTSLAFEVKEARQDAPAPAQNRAPAARPQQRQEPAADDDFGKERIPF